jgi:protein TonB
MSASMPSHAAAERSTTRSRYAWLAGVITIHAALLAAAIAWQGQPPELTTSAVTPPSVVGMLLPPQQVAKPAEAPPAQEKAQPETPKPQPQKPRPAPARVPKPQPKPRAESKPVTERSDIPAPAAKPETAPPAPSENMTPRKVETPAPAPQAAPAEVTPPRSDARAMNQPAAYPPMSRRLREEGRVLLDVHILADGSVGEVKLKQSSGFARLDEAALEAVRRWRYQPARRGDEAIAWWYVQPVAFALNH